MLPAVQQGGFLLKYFCLFTVCLTGDSPNRTGRLADGSAFGTQRPNAASVRTEIFAGHGLDKSGCPAYNIRDVHRTMHIIRNLSAGKHRRGFCLKTVGRIAPGKVPDILPRKESYNGTEKQIQP